MDEVNPLNVFKVAHRRSAVDPEGLGQRLFKQSSTGGQHRGAATGRSVRLLFAGVAVVLASLAVPTYYLAAALDPSASALRAELVESGVRIFKLTACFLGLLLVWIALLPARSEPAASLWRPSQNNSDAIHVQWETVVLIVVFAVATGLRIPGLGGDLWVDEVDTLVDNVRPPLGRILTSYPTDNQHLLYSILAHASVALFGENAVALRLPAMLFGLASLWALLRLGRLLFGRLEVLLAVTLLAVSYHHIWFSQNARGYTGLLLVTILSTELLLRGLRRGSWRAWCAYAAAVAAGMWIHLAMVFVAAAHGLVVLVFALRATARSTPAAPVRGQWRGIGALALAALLTLQLYALVAPQMAVHFAQPDGGSDIFTQEATGLPWLLMEAARGLTSGTGLGWVGLIGAAALLGVGTLSLARRDPIAAALFLLPSLITALSLLMLGRNLWPRLFFNALGFASLLAVHGIFVITRRGTRRFPRPVAGAWRKVAVALALIVAAASASSLRSIYRHPKQDFSGARDFARQQRGRDDRIVVVGLAAQSFSRYYEPSWTSAQTPEELSAGRAPAGYTWLVYTFPQQIASSRPQLWRIIDTEFETVRVFPGTVGDGDVIVSRSVEPGTDRKGRPL